MGFPIVDTRYLQIILIGFRETHSTTVTHWKDFCSQPYLSFRLENIIQTGHWEELEDKFNEACGVVQWESDKLFVSREILEDWGDARDDLGRIMVSYYELKDATSTFELALWKSKLDQADAAKSTNRAAYRIYVPGPVKDRYNSAVP